MNSFIISIMNKYGYFGIVFLIAVENIFPPIPSEVILTLGGFMTSQKGINMNLFGVIFYSTIGSLIGAIILYYVGYLLNKDNEEIFNITAQDLEYIMKPCVMIEAIHKMS